MISTEEMYQVDNAKPVHCMKSATAVTPKLRKNKRIETRWGQKYYATIKEAVFTHRATPYMPGEPPASINDKPDDCQPLYVCKQCGDCFHFLSSLEAHKSRRSWILGYWCQNCFLTNCSHMQKGQPPCFDCQAINRQRKTYLRAKGLRKGRKMACIKIFYNQCQFYAHLSCHRTIAVDMADIMLMPIPLDVERERYGELERLCETLLEHMFLSRTHVMDWLRSKQLGDKWWRLLQSSSEINDNPLAAILKSTKTTRGSKKSDKHLVKPSKPSSNNGALPPTVSTGSSSVAHPTSSNSSSSISETIEAVIAQSARNDTQPLIETKDPETPHSPSLTSQIPLSSPQPMEASDNPCTTADIAFVDCGPVAKTYQSHLAVSLPLKDTPKIILNGSTGRGRIVKLAAIKSTSHLLSKIAGSRLKINQTNNLASDKLPSTPPTANQGSVEPKITVKKFAHEHTKDDSVISNQNNSSKLNNQKPQVTKKLAPAANVKVTGSKTFISPAVEGAKAVEKIPLKQAVSQTTLASLGSRILTVHSPKNADLSQIIDQLPPDVINGRRIVYIGQDSERISLLSKSEALSNLGMIKISSESEKTEISQTLPIEMQALVGSHTTSEQAVKISPKPGNKNILTEQTRPKIQQIYLDRKIVYQNGKKFVIRQTRKTNPGSTPNNSNHPKLQTVSKRVTLSSFLSKSQDLITPPIPIAAEPVETGGNKILPPFIPFTLNCSSPPSSTTSSSSLSPPLSTAESLKGSQLEGQIKENGKGPMISEKFPASINAPDTHVLASTSLAALLLRNVHKFDAVEYYSIDQDVAGWQYIDFSKGKPKPIDANKGLSWSQLLIKYKQQIFDNMLYHGEKRSKQLVEHLKEVNSEYSKMIGATDDARISINLDAIKELERTLNELPLKNDEDLTPVDEDINEILLGFQETTEVTACSVCNRPAKSKSHIAASSAEAPVTDPGCCSCNDYICHICNVFQGNMSRLIGHLNLHAKREPFGCPECLRKFPTFNKLEIHLWTTCFHQLARRWFKCKICRVEGFLDMESLTKHFILAHNKVKLACPLCGILLRSRIMFEKHCEGAHPKEENRVPVNLAGCEVGKYFVRLDQYKTHLDEHVGVIKMLYYKCPWCSFLVRDTNRGKELIKNHLDDSHSEQLSELLSPESLHAIMLSKNSNNMKSQPQSECMDSTEVQSDAIPKCEVQDEAVRELDQLSNCSKSKRRNTEPIASENIENDLQADHQSSAEHFNPTLNKQTLENDIQRCVWSADSDELKSPQATESEQKPWEVGTPAQKALGNRNNVIAEYSLSPQIFDVRSVTPDSYAELESTTKQTIIVKSEEEGALKLVSDIPKAQIAEASDEVKTPDSPDQPIVPKSESEDSVFVRLGEELLPVKLPEVIVINQANTNINLNEVFQSTMTGSNTLIKLQDLDFNKQTVKGNAGIKLVELPAESNYEKSDVLNTNEPSVPVIKTVFTLAPLPASVESKKNTILSELLESGKKRVEQSVDGEEPLQQSASLLKLKNTNSTTKTATNIVKASNRVSKARGKTPQKSGVNANAPVDKEGKITDSLVCDVPKPPPLARIPRLIEASRLQIPLEENEESQEIRRKKLVARSPVKLRRKQKRPWRIALNAPIGTSERTDYHCHLCGEPIDTSWPVIESHFNSKHYEDYKLVIVTPRLLRMSSEFITSGYKDVFGSRKRKFDGNVPGSKRRKRWSPKKHVEKYPLDLGLCVEQESVQDGEGKFICKKCDERCDDILSLRTHIGTNHRIKDHYLVCLECGENFVVKPSLQMHLKVFHSIKDSCTYLAQNTAYIKELTETGEGEPKTGIANQCHVCMAVFEDKSAVDKHLRVHGMAFLNRKRIEARIAARNPEKKIKMEKVDNSSTIVPSEAKKIEDREVGKTKPDERVVSRSGEAEIERPCQDKSIE